MSSLGKKKHFYQILGYLISSTFNLTLTFLAFSSVREDVILWVMTAVLQYDALITKRRDTEIHPGNDL